MNKDYSITDLTIDCEGERFFYDLDKYVNLKTLKIMYNFDWKIPFLPNLEEIHTIDTIIVIPDGLPKLKRVCSKMIEVIFVNKDKYPDVIFDCNDSIIVPYEEEYLPQLIKQHILTRIRLSMLRDKGFIDDNKVIESYNEHQRIRDEYVSEFPVMNPFIL